MSTYASTVRPAPLLTADPASMLPRPVFAVGYVIDARGNTRHASAPVCPGASMPERREALARALGVSIGRVRIER